MSKSKRRRRWTAEQKWQTIREARQTDNTVSEVCRCHGIASGQFYSWENRHRRAL